MNKQRREQIQKAINELDSVMSIVEDAASEEQEYFDNMPEGFQQGEKGERADEVASELEEARSNLEDCLNALESCME